MSPLGVYLVERYLPDIGVDGFCSLVVRLEAASAEMRRADTPVRHLDSTFVPGEESCFCRFEAPSAEATMRLNRLANAPYARVLPALALPSRDPQAG